MGYCLRAGASVGSTPAVCSRLAKCLGARPHLAAVLGGDCQAFQGGVKKTAAVAAFQIHQFQLNQPS